MEHNQASSSAHGHKFGRDLPDIPEDSTAYPTPASDKRKSRPWSIQSYPSFGGQAGMGGRPESMQFFDAAALESARRHNNDAPQLWPPPAKPTQEVITASKETGEEAPRKVGWLLVFSLFMSVFLSALDITIITTALPTIADDMGTNATGFTWIGSAYLLAGGASEPIWAKCSDIFGRKPVLLLANLVFLAGSVICAVSKSISVLILGRVTQGLGSGGLLVLVNILIGDLFSPRERGKYYGLLGLVWAVANAIGPLMGGLFSEKMSWQWCFWINVPCDGIALLMTFAFLKVHTPQTPFWEGIKAIDWLGSATVLSGTIMLLVGLEFGGVTFPWGSAPVIALIIVGFIVWVCFFIIEAYVPKYPLIPLHIFKNFSNLVILAVDFSHGFVFIAGSYFLPVYFQAILGASPLMSGVYLFPFVVALSVSAVATGQIISKTGQYSQLITGGMLFMTLGFALFIDLPATTSWARLVIYQIIAGLGVGTNFQSPMLALQMSVKPHEIGPATSTFGFVRQLANAVSLVFGNVILQNQLQTHRQTFFDTGMSESMVNMLTTDGMAVASVAQINKLPTFQRETTQELFTQSLQKAWIMYTCVGIVGLGLTDFIVRKKLSWDHQETKTGLDAQETYRQEDINEKIGTIGVLPDSDSPEPYENQQQQGVNTITRRLSPILQGTEAEHQNQPVQRTMSNRAAKSPAGFSIDSTKVGDYRSEVSHIENASPVVTPGVDGLLHPNSREGAIRGARRRSNIRDRTSAISTGASRSSFGGGLALGGLNTNIERDNDRLTPKAAGTPRRHYDAEDEADDYEFARSPLTPSGGYFPPSYQNPRHQRPDEMGERAAVADNDWYDDVISNRNVQIENIAGSPIAESSQGGRARLVNIPNQLRHSENEDERGRPSSFPNIQQHQLHNRNNSRQPSSQFEARIHISELDIDSEGDDHMDYHTVHGNHHQQHNEAGPSSSLAGLQQHPSPEERHRAARAQQERSTSAWRSSSPAYSFHEDLPTSPSGVLQGERRLGH